MGFFKKIFKGVKKVFKKIGKGIKGVFKGIGKFMNKIGIVGQIALMFVPGIGPMLNGLLKGLGGMASHVLTTYGGALGNSIVQGAQFVIGKAGEFAGAVKNTFKTVTDGISTFASEFTKTGLNKLGFDPVKFGWSEGSSFNQWVQSGKGQGFGDAWNKVTTSITENANKILDPFKKNITAGSNATLADLSDSTYKSMEEIKNMNPQITDWSDIGGKAINLDPDKTSQLFGAGPLQSTADRAMAAQQAQPSLLDKFQVEEVPSGRTVSLDAFDPSSIDPTTGNIIPQSTTSLKHTPTAEDVWGITKDLVPPTPEGFKGVPFKTPDQLAAGTGNALADTGGSLLGMPSMGEAATQAGITTASQLAAAHLSPRIDYSTAGSIVYGEQAAPIQGATPMQQISSIPTPGLRDNSGLFGYGNGANNNYAYMQYMNPFAPPLGYRGTT
tara:strand:+ start:3413 stop:4735 length:1323 start_codon:yes stop_codon:yes gene_type:complete